MFFCSSPGSTPLPQIRPPRTSLSAGHGHLGSLHVHPTPCHSGEGRNPGLHNVIPAKAGIQRHPACDLRGLCDDTRDPSDSRECKEASRYGILNQNPCGGAASDTSALLQVI